MNNVQSKAFHYSKFSKRIAAYLIDLLALLVILSVEMLIFVKLKPLIGDKNYELLIDILGLLNGIIYFSVFEASTKQATLGKQAMRLIVCDLEGARLSFGKAFIRNAVKFIGSIICILFKNDLMAILNFIGCIVALFTAKRQALHDIVCGSVVIDKYI